MNQAINVPKTDSRSIFLFFTLFLLATAAWLTVWQLPVGWTADDGAHLRFSSVYPISKYLLDPELLRIASYANLTPLLNVYYSLNLALFGLDPNGWRIGQSVLAAISVVSFYLGASAFMHRWPSLFAAAAWVAGVPFFYTTATHMTSHYIIGMVCASLCVWFFGNWARHSRIFDLLLAVMCYGLAIFSKEIFLPLPALLLLLRPLRTVLRGMPAIVLVGIAYLLLRKLVLGTFVGGYRGGCYIGNIEWMSLLQAMPNLLALMVGGRTQAIAWGVTLLVLIWHAKNRRGMLLAALSLTAIVAVIPLIPLMTASPLTQPDRYLFFASALLCAVVALAFDQVWHVKTIPHWVLVSSAAVLLLIQCLALAPAVSALAQALNFQVQVYGHVLKISGPMLIINPNLPADVSYWSQVLNASREAQARLSGKDNYDRVLFVSDAQAPVQFGLNQIGIPIYLYDSKCGCILPIKPTGEPTHKTLDIAQQTLLLYLENPARRPENNQSAYGDSVQLSRYIASDDPKALEIVGSINLGTELDWLYMVLPDRTLPRLIGTGPTPVTGPPDDLRRFFRVRLQFGSTELASEALKKLCVSVPAVRKSHFALLQGQPDYCSMFVNEKLHQPA